MGYQSKSGKSSEYASKSSHGYIVKDKEVQTFLDNCNLPDEILDISLDPDSVIKIEDCENPIKHIIAVDGGYTEVTVKAEFPSSKIAFFQFGPLIFKVDDLDSISKKFFIDPSDIEKLKNIQRFKFTLPTKNIRISDEDSLVNSIRNAIFKFFCSQPDDDHFIETLKWFIFEEYDTPKDEWELASCPSCGSSGIRLKRSSIKDNKFTCQNCKNSIYLTDIFRFHEIIDNELGAQGMLGYLTNLLEQMVIVHLIRIILKTKPSLLKETLFIKDGPLAFFGQTANLHKPMRALLNYLNSKHSTYLVGLEKSGAFVEHANQIRKFINSGEALLLSNDHIYKYIIPGKADQKNPYGITTYFGNKVIYKADDNRTYVCTIPSSEARSDPKKDDLFNIDVILRNVKKLKCDMYDNALIPVALANKLVSLANHPSSTILEKFAKDTLLS